MTSDTVDFLMSQKDGANYVVLYQMLCLKTINTGGRLSRRIGEYLIPYDMEKIQRDCKWFSTDTVRVALDLYKRLGLIYEDVDGTLVLAEHESMVGSETDWGEKKRRQRAALPSGDIVPTYVPSDVPQSVPTEIDIRDKRLESRDKRSDTDNRDIPDTTIETDNHEIEEKTASCAEPPVTGRSTPKKKHPEPTPSEFNILLSDNSTYNVPQENIEVYRGLYPGVDVEQQLRNMVGWSLTAGPKRKTRNGVKRFITAWLIREQDKASKKGGRNGANRSGAGQGAGGYKPLFDGETVV
jgi:hypothetical protein